MRLDHSRIARNEKKNKKKATCLSMWVARSSRAVELASLCLAGNTEWWRTVEISQTCRGAFPAGVTFAVGNGPGHVVCEDGLQVNELQPKGTKHNSWERVGPLFQPFRCHFTAELAWWTRRQVPVTVSLAVSPWIMAPSLGARCDIRVLVNNCSITA